MIDRLIPLLLALTIVAPAAVRPDCCCVTPGVAETCCQAEANELPPCCREGCSEAPVQEPCGCADCPANRPLDPIANPASQAEVPPTQDSAASASWISPLPPLDGRLRRSVALDALQLNRPPPDRQAVLCVWTT